MTSPSSWATDASTRMVCHRLNFASSIGAPACSEGVSPRDRNEGAAGMTGRIVPQGVV